MRGSLVGQNAWVFVELRLFPAGVSLPYRLSCKLGYMLSM